MQRWRDAKFDVAAALDALTKRGLNTPANVDGDGVCRVVDALDSTTKRVVLMSSIGVTKRREMPFKILNAAGVLSAKARGEAFLKKAKCDYTIVRPGQLFGGVEVGRQHDDCSRSVRQQLLPGDPPGARQGISTTMLLDIFERTRRRGPLRFNEATLP